MRGRVVADRRQGAQAAPTTATKGRGKGAPAGPTAWARTGASQHGPFAGVDGAGARPPGDALPAGGVAA